jgi:predicted O-methyltransferase YrrM
VTYDAPQQKWTAVDDYICEHLVAPDPALDAALKESDAAGLPAIQVSPNQGKLLALLAGIHGARTILEIGTLGGYSTIWLARALPPGGRLITLEISPSHAAVAHTNVVRAGLGDRVDVRVGPALETLAALEREGRAPFDMFFIDADKQNNAAYFAWAVRLSRPGSLVIVDNVVRKGEIVDAASSDAMVQGTRRLYEAMATEQRAIGTAIQTVGSKGYDGFALAVVTGGG